MSQYASTMRGQRVVQDYLSGEGDCSNVQRDRETTICGVRAKFSN